MLPRFARSPGMADGVARCLPFYWLVLLGDRRERVEQEWERRKAGGLEIDRIVATQFADKRQILVKSGLIQCSRSRAERELGSVEDLRNGLAHANNYASTRGSAGKTITAVKLARKWIATLQEGSTAITIPVGVGRSTNDGTRRPS